MLPVPTPRWSLPLTGPARPKLKPEDSVDGHSPVKTLTRLELPSARAPSPAKVPCKPKPPAMELAKLVRSICSQRTHHAPITTIAPRDFQQGGGDHLPRSVTSPPPTGDFASIRNVTRLEERHSIAISDLHQKRIDDLHYDEQAEWPHGRSASAGPSSPSPPRPVAVLEPAYDRPAPERQYTQSPAQERQPAYAQPEERHTIAISTLRQRVDDRMYVQRAVDLTNEARDNRSRSPAPTRQYTQPPAHERQPAYVQPTPMYHERQLPERQYIEPPAHQVAPAYPSPRLSTTTKEDLGTIIGLSLYADIHGVRVVRSTGPAKVSGIKAGEYVTGINHVPVKSLAQFREQLAVDLPLRPSIILTLRGNGDIVRVVSIPTATARHSPSRSPRPFRYPDESSNASPSRSARGRAGSLSPPRWVVPPGNCSPIREREAARQPYSTGSVASSRATSPQRRRLTSDSVPIVVPSPRSLLPSVIPSGQWLPQVPPLVVQNNASPSRRGTRGYRDPQRPHAGSPVVGPTRGNPARPTFH